MTGARDLFSDDSGFTTTSMVLSLLITLALVFSAAQVYRIESASAEVQDVADAAALAAQNQVAEYLLVARYCDAIVLSLSLSGVVVTGLGIVALCTPPTASMSEGLVKAGKDLLRARDAFSDRAVRVLGKFQEALPYLAAACAAGVAQANDADSQGASYLGVAMLVPSEGEALEPTSSRKSQELVDEVESRAGDIREQAKRAEEAADEAQRCKQRAFERDCGDAPSYCMYERAAHLAGLSGADNPIYGSVDAWSFSVALDRAKRYYRARFEREAPGDSSVAEQARSALRKRYFGYVVEIMEEGYVSESGNSFSAYFPHPPANTAEMRQTSLYTEQVYPISQDVTQIATPVETEEGPAIQVSEEVSFTMHAWPGCPNAAEAVGYGSIADMEAGSYEVCPACGFSAASLGKVAAASTSIDNGFEFHYAAVADEARAYGQALREAEPLKQEVRQGVGDLLGKLVEAAKESAGKRIDPKPPGSMGSIAFVVNSGTTAAVGGFASGFVAPSGSLGPRAAVSAATLLDEGSDEGRTAINSALDGLRESGGVLVGAAGMVLDVWSWLLVAYSDGQDAVESAVENGLNALPLVGASGLGTWAAGKLSGAIEAMGLQPAKVGALKPVLVNSGHVASKGDGQAGRFLAVKQRIIAHPAMSTDLFASALSEAERLAVAEIDGLGDSIQIASIELLGAGGPSIPITVPLPPSAKAEGIGAVQALFGRIRSYYVEFTGVRIWE